MDPDGMGDAAATGVLVRIRGLLPALAPAERRVADAVLADPSGVAGRSITALARQCTTSETTVVRFCRSAGFSGYPQLRLALAAEAGRAVSQGPRRALAGDIGPGDDLATVVQKICFADARAIEDTGVQLDVEALGRVVDAVADARRVELFGVGASAIVTADLEQKLRRIGHAAFACDDAHGALTSAALLTEGDVAIGVSHTGTTYDTIEPLVEAGRRGALTVAITNFPRSPITEVVDVVLTTAARETTFRSGAMASRLAQLTVVDCLFVGVAQRHYDETVEALERTYGAIQGRRHGGSGGRRPATGGGA
jgi:DNA-binding MurR/RpiR family transcriptional regulator